jgi:outer membrane protein TolC
MMQRWIVVGVLLGLPVWAFGPQEALAYRSPELGPAQALLEAARQRAEAVNLGLTTSLSATRADGNNSYSAGVSWQWGFTSRIEAALAVSRAERQLRQLKRDGQRDALLAHAGLWLAQSRLSASLKRLEASQTRLEASRQRLELGAVSALQHQEAAVAARQAELLWRQAQVSLSAAGAEAARLGLRGSARAQTARFALPESIVDRGPAYQEAAASLQLAQARLDEAGRSLLPELNLTAGYTGADAQLQSTASWTGRGPGASLLLGSIPTEVRNLPPSPVTGLRPGQNEWRLSLGARLALPLEALPALRQLEAERDLAAVRLERTRAELTLRLASARAEAEHALEGLELSQERLQLATRHQAVAQARLQAGSASPIEALEAQAGVSEAEAGVAQAWQAYITAVARFLELSDGEWSLQ